MKKIKILNAKNLLAILLSLLLVAVSAFGILAGTRKTVNATTVPNTVRRSYRAVNAATVSDLVYTDYRARLMTITDMGQLKNEYDVFDCVNRFPTIGTLIDSGYRYVTIDIDFDLREIDDGYQDVYLYKSLNAAEGDYFNRIILDYGTNKTNTAWGHVYLKFKSVTLYDFTDKDFNMGLVIRYDGHGKDNDTWQNRNWTIKVTLSQTKKNSANTISGTDVRFG